MRVCEWSCQPLIPIMMAGLLAFLLGASPPAGAQAPWAMTGCGSNLSGQSTFIGAQLPSVKWSFTLPSSPGANQMPVVGADGTVYVLADTSGPMFLYAVTPGGLTKWASPVGVQQNGATSTAAIAPNGSIIVAYDRLYAFAPNGTPLWSCAGPNGASTPVIGSDAVYFASGGTLVAVKPTGTVKWAKAIDTAISTPALGLNGLIAVTSGKKLVALDTTGVIRGTYTAAAPLGQPVIGPDGAIYAAGANNTLYAVSATGSFKWAKNLGATVATPAVSANNTIYCGVGTNSVVALSATGCVKWVTPTVETLNYSAPAIGSNGVVYITANAGWAHLYALCPSGTVLWDYVSSYYDGEFYSAPAIGTNGTVYVLSDTTFGTYNGIVAFRPPTDSGKLQPDLGIYVAPTGSYIGNNIYNTNGTGQCSTTPIGPGVTRQYRIPVQNDGLFTTNFKLTATAANGNWAVRYFIYPSDIPLDITKDIITIGWTTPPLAKGQTLEVFAEVAMKSAIAAGTKLTLALGAECYGDSRCYDLVTMTTQVQGICSQPDLALCATLDGTPLCGNNIINTDGSNQVLTKSIVPAGETKYYLHIQNKGNTATAYRVSAPKINGNWSIILVTSSGQEITAACTSAYYQTPVVAPGGEILLGLAIRANCAVTAGQSLAVPLRVWSAKDSTARDSAIARAVYQNGCPPTGTSEPPKEPTTTVGLD